MTAAAVTAPSTTTNERAAATICRHATDLAEARELLEICGIVEPGGSEILPDQTGGIRVPSIGRMANMDGPPPSPVDPDEPRARHLTTPPGLRVLPPLSAAPAVRKPPKPKKAADRDAADDGVRQHGRRTEAKPRADVPRRQRAAVAVCGSTGGYARHKRLKESICDPCREAKNAYWRERDAARRVEQGRPSAGGRKKAADCGTRSGYMRHLRLKEPTCPACRAANNRGTAAGSPEEARLLAAGVNPVAAAVLAAGATGGAPPETPTEGTAPGTIGADAAGTAPEPSGSGHGYAGPDAQPQVSPSRSHSGEGGGLGASDAPAAPPAAGDWLTQAQRSPHRAVARAAALTVGLRLRVETATTAQLADGRLLARLDAALDDVARAQARAPKQGTGDT
ncbi:hypothetical protein [Blastococcus sp. CT_GayMR16]|uniref:hypothetical protein n=1 Tax=Blastococcus sp. CT_GayMR16 TaxID=2559607 RepID=UPI0010744193|nr:hypothetical protein [Blastococcus sp. CT_GayMR16]TFV90419.1 hypothetical protein E4P38_02980 [Blastococcus sp. CT_GayMR16]